ncbi:hypothetical protein BIWAKO_04658 [Bosea sp. BIWAKO-01]|nr:hypothetical protein BIWAKO_04658 [Bosea sp. BIWAKO-01]
MMQRALGLQRLNASSNEVLAAGATGVVPFGASGGALSETKPIRVS